jgi:GNAT superfamily N-acetyltransferase
VGHRHGPVATLDAVVVRPVDRGLGAGAHLLAAWCSAAAERGAAMVVARDDDAGTEFLTRHGFVVHGGLAVRTL